jgi:DNA repair exonuclease SbcCD ATPase subunit
MSAYGHIEKSAVLTEYYSARQLKEDLKQRDQVWKQKFAVTHDLREGQEKHKEATDQSFREVHSRIDAIERNIFSRAEVEKRMKVLVQEVQGCMDKTFSCSEALKELTARVQRQEQYCAQTFVTKLELENLEKRQAEMLRESKADAQAAIAAIRQESAAKKEVDEGFKAAGERSTALENATASLRRDLSQLDKSLDALSHQTEDRFAKKLGLKELETTLMLEIQRRDDSHANRIDRLSVSHASKQHVDDRVAVCQQSLEALRENLIQVSKEVEEKTQHLAELDRLCKETLAPRSELQSLSTAVKEDRMSSEKVSADVKQLLSDADSDRERLTGMSRSVQSNRSDLNSLAVQMQEFRELREDYNRNKQHTAELQETLEHREREHFKEMKADHLMQTQVIERLDLSVNQIKGECKTLAEKQEKDNQMLREMSTKSYMEALDHALGLEQKLKSGQHGAA